MLSTVDLVTKIKELHKLPELTLSNLITIVDHDYKTGEKVKYTSLEHQSQDYL